jgi:predicted MFS family arabinose efflux permease
MRKFNPLRVRDKKMVLKVCTPEFLVGAGAGLFIPFVNLYFKTRLGASPTQIASYYAGARIMTIAGFILAPVLVKRFGMVRCIVATKLFSLPFLFVMAVFTDPFMVVFAYLVRQSLMNMAEPANANFAMEVVSPGEQAMTNSMRILSSTGARALFAMFGGRIIQTYGFEPAIIGTCILYLSAALSYILLFGKHPLFRSSADAPPRQG